LQRRLRRRSAHPCHGGRVPSPTDHDADDVAPCLNHRRHRRPS
jgi:hypothetical protein